MKLKYRLLHIVVDDKFTDGVIKHNSNSSIISHKYVLIGKHSNERFNYIKNAESIEFCNSVKEFVSIINESSIDAVYLYGLHLNWYKYIKVIPPSIPVIWWSWGYDLYNSSGLVPPYVQINMLKEATMNYFNTNFEKWYKTVVKYIIDIFEYPFISYRKKNILKYISYIRPILPIEYSLIPHTGEWHHIKQFPAPCRINNEPFKLYSKTGLILIGNSATLSNNHIDIFSTIELNIRGNYQYIVPISYGIKRYANDIYNRFNGPHSFGNVTCLSDFLPKGQYNEIMDNCTHAIFGVIRQQAMGNIYACLKKGIKLFLYKDSTVYKQLKEMDEFIIFTIDEDLTDEQLSNPLTKEEARYNYENYLRFNQNCKSFDEIVCDIIEKKI